VGVLGGIRIKAHGAIELLGDSGAAIPVATGSTGLTYGRAKGPKTTVQIFDTPGAHTTVAAAIPKFARVFGVDTNSCTHDDERISVSTVSEIKDFRLVGTIWSCRFETLWGAELRDVRGDAERIGWYEALVRLSARNWLNNALLVVDAHLGELPRIARREVPLLGECFLPDNMWLAYASSDTAGESPLNRVIGLCDAVSTKVLKHVSENESLEPSLTLVSDDAPYRAFRHWKFDVS
jgi:hypothetical protein